MNEQIGKARMKDGESDFKPMRAAGLMAALMAAYLLSFVDRQLLSLLVGPIKLDLGLSDLQLGLLQGMAFSLFFCLAGLPIGWAVDTKNRKWLIIAGVLLWSGATVACGFAAGFAALFGARIAVGVGEAVITPAAYSMIADTYPPERLVRATALFGIAGVVGVGLAFVAGGIAIDAISHLPSLPASVKPWQATFILVGSPGLVVALAFLLVREPPRQQRRGEGVTWRDTCAYLIRRRRDFAALYASSVCLATVAYSVLAWYPTHLMRMHGLSASSAGMILGIIYLVCAPLGALSGPALSEFFARRGKRAPLLLVIMITAVMLFVGIILAIFIKNLVAAILCFTLVALAQCSYPGILTGALMLVTPSRMRGVNASCFILVTNLTSLGLGTALVGGLSDAAFPGRPEGIGMSLAIICGISTAAAIAVAWKGIASFDDALNAALRD